MNIKKFVPTVIAGFVFVFLYEWLFHGNMLMGLYARTANLWRSVEDMQAHMPLMMAMQFTFVLILAFIFTRNYEGRGIGEGLRFGIYMGALMGFTAFSTYCFMPISFTLALAWLIGTFIEVLGLGVIFALTYKTKSREPGAGEQEE